MESLAAYIPLDRCRALARGETLPEYAHGAVLFVDISGFTPLTEAFVQEFGPVRGAEALTHQLNLIYDALISEVNSYGGSVIGFAGDAITCWLENDHGLRPTACALAMQERIQQFASIVTPSGTSVSLAMKAAIATGPVRRFMVGDPQIQVMDVLAGATLDRMAAAERHANKGEVILAPETVAAIQDKIKIAAWRIDTTRGTRFATVAGLHTAISAQMRPALPQVVCQQQEENGNEYLLTEAQVRPWLLPPVYERINAGQEQFLAEIRPAVAMFLRFSGIDYDHDALAGTQLDTYIRWVQSVLADYEGFLLQVTMGDKGSYLYGAFGAPYAHDDDPERAVAAALDLLSPPSHAASISQVQIGISQGRMRAGPYGGTTRRTYGVLGDEVNTAARLMSNAPPGHILISQRIVDTIESRYHLRSLGKMKVKGKREPIAVSLVLGRQQTPRSQVTSLFRSPPVGRDNELQVLSQHLQQALEGAGQVVRLEGVAGIGKSHLVAAFGATAEEQGVWLLDSVCQSTSQQIAYTPWQQILRGLLELDQLWTTTQEATQRIAALEATIRQRNPDWLLRLPLLGDLLDLPIPDNPTTAAFEPRLRQEALFSLVVDLIQTAAHRRPMLLLFDDVHWIDEASAALVLAVGRVIAHLPIIICIVHRPPIHEDRPILPDLCGLVYHHHLNLSELDTRSTAALVARRLQGPLTSLALSLIQSRAQGNPFFTEELVDTLRETRILYRQFDGTWDLSAATIDALRAAQCLIQDPAGTGWLIADTISLSSVELGIPDTIHSIVLSRIDRLPEAHKLTLKVASVIGRIFELDVLSRIHPMSFDMVTLQGHLHTFERRDFARLEVPAPHTTYMFKHNVTQEVAYETLLESQQRDMHRAVAEVLEYLQPEAIETLAYHYTRSGVRDKMLFYLDKAARKSRYDFANETALHYYTLALAHEERWEWRYGQAAVFHILGRREEEQAALQAMEAAPDAPLFLLAYQWGQYYEATGDYDQARAAIERALHDCQQRNDTVGQGRCLGQLGQIARRQGDYASARSSYDQALELLQRIRPDSDRATRVLAEVLNGLGTVHLQQGRFDEAKACYLQALEARHTIADRLGEAQTLNSLGTQAYYQRLFTEALGYYHQSLELRRTIGDRAGEGTSLYNLSIMLQDAGDYDEARQYASGALTIQQAVGDRWGEANTWNGLGVIYQELGDLRQAQECLQQALHLSATIGDEAGQAYILANLGLVARDSGDLATAGQLLADGLALARAQDDKDLVSTFLNYQSTVSLQAGQPEQAIELAQAALELRRALNLHPNTADDLTTLAAAHLALGDMSRAVEYAHQALAILDECGGEGPEFPHQDYFICYQVLQAAGSFASAREALQAAYSMMMARAHNITDEHLRRSFLHNVPIHRELLETWQKHAG